MFGKLVEGELVLAPQPLRVNGLDVFTDDPAIFEKCGYLPVEYVAPEDIAGTILIGFDWVETDGKIIQNWNYQEADA